MNPSLINRKSLFDRLCQGPHDGALPSYFHIPLQQYALSGVETDRVLTETEQEMWRRTVLLGYVINKRNDRFFYDFSIPSFLSPELIEWLNTVEYTRGTMPVTRFMTMLNRHISPYDRLYDLNSERSVIRFLTDVVTIFETLQGLPSPLQPQAIFDYLAGEADGITKTQGHSYPLSRGMLHIWRYMVSRVPFVTSDPLRRADFLLNFFRLIEAMGLDARLIPPQLVAYLNTVQYPLADKSIGITGLMIEVFRMAGITEDERWTDPQFISHMAIQFYKEAYHTLLLPESVGAAHDEMAKVLGVVARRPPAGEYRIARQRARIVWQPPAPRPVDSQQADLNMIGCDDFARQGEQIAQRLQAMLRTGPLKLVAMPSNHELATRELEGQKRPEEVPYGPINLMACPLHRIADFMVRRGLDVFEDRYNIVYASWGTDRLPHIHKVALPLLDEIWVPSAAQKEIFEKDVKVPVHVVPASINLAPPSSVVTRKQLNLPEDTFLFLTCFDAVDWMSRKNPMAVVQAFLQAFTKGEKVGLIIKTRNIAHSVGTREEGHLVRLQKIWRNDPRLFTVHDDYNEQEMSALLNLADAYASLPRATAFDATLAEAMAWGKPVVATGAGGHADFVNADNATLVSSVPCSVVFDAYHFLDKEVGHRWMDPDIEEAARAMQLVFTGSPEIVEKTQRAKDTVRTQYSAQACAARAHTRIDTILKRLAQERGV